MKRIMFGLTVTIFVAMVVFVISVSAGGKGAVKVTMTDVVSGDVGGYAIFNVTANGKVIVQVHIDNGLSNTTYDFGAGISSPPGTYLLVDWIELTTNGQGKGNAQIKLDIPDGTPHSIYVDTTVKIGTWEPQQPGEWFWSDFQILTLKK